MIGNYQVVKPEDLIVVNDNNMEKYLHDMKMYLLQKDWIRRAKQFADRYVQGNLKELTYLLKDVSNNKFWQDLNRVYQDVSWEQMIEQEDNTKLAETVACAGGKCEI